jgi:uncharacterized protein DUF6622
MLPEILLRTPPWVFALFFVLLGFGLHQSRPRVVPLARAMALPLAMIVLSAYGVVSAFGWSLAGASAWAAAVAVAVYANRFLRYPRGVRFEPATRSLSVPGSWVPLSLMMAIFFTKYAVGVTLARTPGVSTAAAFVVPVSAAYGLLSGFFLAGALSIWRTGRKGTVLAGASRQTSATPSRPLSS